MTTTTITCPVCGGEYARERNGEAYLHACPPLLDALTVSRNGETRRVSPEERRDGEEELERHYVERPHKIDENINPPE